jgi:hypothetical protein
MAEAARAAKRVGAVHADGEGGDVLEENGVFYSIGTTIVITDDDQEVVESTRSDDYPTLAAFVSSLPSGARFVQADMEESGKSD